MPELQRFTTQYVLSQDRIRLTGEDDSGLVQVLWLTRRLLKILLPHLFGWLAQPSGETGGKTASSAERSARSEALQGFVQQSVRAEHAAAPPVPPVQPANDGWLVLSVELAFSQQALSLTFIGAKGEKACLVMSHPRLRLWLDILYRHCQKADWSVADWPTWVSDEPLSPSKSLEVVLH